MPERSEKIHGTIITAAINGGRLTKADHPRLPVTPIEIAAESRRCMSAGAAMVHVHARSETGEHTLDAGLYREVTDEIEHATDGDVIVQATTETLGVYRNRDIIQFTRKLQPEAVSIALSELIPSGDEEAEAHKLFSWMNEVGIWSQLILYSADDVARLHALQAKGIIPVDYNLLLFVLGRYAENRQSKPAELDPFVLALADDETPWAVCAFGRHENACAARAIERGGHVRVGFENNFYLPDGELAQSSADLVALAVAEAKTAARPALDARAVRAHFVPRG